MWPDVVVVGPPVVDGGALVVQAGEPVQIKAILAKLAVEALNERILGRLPWPDEVQLHTSAPWPRRTWLSK